MPRTPFTRIEASQAARALMTESKASGRRLSYTQALAKLAEQHGYANVHDLTSNYVEARQPAPIFQPLQIAGSTEALLARLDAVLDTGGILFYHCDLPLMGHGNPVLARITARPHRRLLLNMHSPHDWKPLPLPDGRFAEPYNERLAKEIRGGIRTFLLTDFNKAMPAVQDLVLASIKAGKLLGVDLPKNAAIIAPLSVMPGKTRLAQLVQLGIPVVIASDGKQLPPPDFMRPHSLRAMIERIEDLPDITPDLIRIMHEDEAKRAAEAGLENRMIHTTSNLAQEEFLRRQLDIHDATMLYAPVIRPERVAEWLKSGLPAASVTDRATMVPLFKQLADAVQHCVDTTGVEPRKADLIAVDTRDLGSKHFTLLLPLRDNTSHSVLGQHTYAAKPIPADRLTLVKGE